MIEPVRYDQKTPEQQRRVDERDLEILRLHETGLSQGEIARRLGIAQSTVQRVLHAMQEWL